MNRRDSLLGNRSYDEAYYLVRCHEFATAHCYTGTAHPYAKRKVERFGRLSYADEIVLVDGESAAAVMYGDHRDRDLRIRKSRKQGGFASLTLGSLQIALYDRREADVAASESLDHSATANLSHERLLCEPPNGWTRNTLTAKQETYRGVTTSERIIHSALVPSDREDLYSTGVEAKKASGQLSGDDVGRAASSRILDAMHGSDFILSVTRANHEATQSVETLEDMVMWVERLQPYFDFDPEMTVANALQLYLDDRPRKTSRPKVEPARAE